MKEEYNTVYRKDQLKHIRKEIKHPLIGEFGALFSVLSFFPVVWHVTRTGNVDCMSWMWIGLSFIANVLWLWSGLIDNLSANIMLGAPLIIILIYLAIFKYSKQ